MADKDDAFDGLGDLNIMERIARGRAVCAVAFEFSSKAVIVSG
jgi:hypothetical protein